MMTKRRKSLRSSAIAGAFMVAAIAVMLPASAVAATPVQIGGPTAAAWVASGQSAGIGVTLVATPANGTAHTYAGTGADSMFDAPDRDTIGGRTDGPFGLGVDNTSPLLTNGMPGVTSYPSEIGFYGNAAICGEGMLLGTNCADQLAVTLDKDVYGGSFELTFFYGSEQSGETALVKLFLNGAEVHSQIYGPAPTGAYSSVNPGRYEFDLPDMLWDKIVFIADNNNVADATDFLVEFVTFEGPPLGGGTATGLNVANRITPKGNWFMYNHYQGSGDQCFDLQLGNPKDGLLDVGEFCIERNLNNVLDQTDDTFTATYDLYDDVTIGGFVYDLVLLNAHLAVSNTPNFTGNPGQDANQTWGVPFADVDGDFYVFAHFSLDYV